jgi:large subunit ribosomal protein L29
MKAQSIESIRNLTEDELRQQQLDLNDQLFRLKFQLKMGQTESLKKIRGLRRDVARIKTIQRQRQLEATGRHFGHGSLKAAPAAEAEAASGAAARPAAAKKAAAKKAVVKKAAVKKTAATTRKK